MKWGLLGYGKIARKFIGSLNALADEELVAIASGSNFQQIKHDFDDRVKAYSSYDDLLKDQKVEIVYINTTHNFHRENTIAAMDADKHVLCEKPLGVSRSEVESMINKASDRRKFLMEAMWTRFLPAYRQMKEIIREGRIGKPMLVQANFAFRAAEQNPSARLFNPGLAGGSILDVGIYPIALMIDVFDDIPDRVEATANLSNQGIDNNCSMFFRFSENRSAHLFSSILQDSHHHAYITGTRGWIKMIDFWHGQKLLISVDQKEQLIEAPYKANGYLHEIEAAVASIAKGEIQNPVMNFKDSMDIATVMDEVMKKVGYGQD